MKNKKANAVKAILGLAKKITKHLPKNKEYDVETKRLIEEGKRLFGEKANIGTNYLRCSTCGKRVSSVPFVSEPVIAAYVECPECIQKSK